MARGMQDYGIGRTRALLLATLVVVAAGAVFILMGRDDDRAEADEATRSAEPEVLEVTPLLPSGALESASWHDQGTRQASPEPDHADETVSLLEQYGHEAGESEQNRKFRESLEEVVGEIHGLGVYVTPEEDKSKEREE